MRSVTVLLAVALAAGSVGCIKQALIDGQIEGTRQGSSALDTIGDYELAQTATQAGLSQFEGMHALAPSNTDGLFLLTKGWTGYAYGFVEDELQVAEDAGDEALAEYHRKRARMAYDRAVFYGLELLGHRASGFDEAKKSEPALAKWLAAHFTADDVPALFWTGYAWLARADLMKGDEEEGPAFVADLFVGVAMIERSTALDPSFEHYAGLIALGAYHARTAMAELDESKRLLDTALAKTEGKNLMVELTTAVKYACVRGDGALYQGMLEKVLQAQDPDPYERLTNAIAKRRARRWLARKRAKDACGIDVTSTSGTPPRAPVPSNGGTP
jgi:hypothetical protein